jgi:cytochrome d ubiquinol oxidase subunit I
MAAAEALWETSKPASLSVFATGDFRRNPGHTNVDLRLPHVLSFLATSNPNGKVEGIDQIQAKERAQYGPGDYVPVVGVTYWTFRAMIGAGTLVILITLLGLLYLRRRRLPEKRWLLRLLLLGAALPPIANSAGWIFTEMGRQPWVVFGLLRTDDAVSPLVSSGTVALTLVGYTLIYATLAAVGGWLFVREVKHGPPDERPVSQAPGAEPLPDLALTY